MRRPGPQGRDAISMPQPFADQKRTCFWCPQEREGAERQAHGSGVGGPQATPQSAARGTDAARRGLWEDHGLIFPNRVGKPMNARNLIIRSFKPLLERAAFPGRCACTTFDIPAPLCCSAKACTPRSYRNFSGTPLSLRRWIPTPTCCQGWATQPLGRWRKHKVSGLQYGCSREPQLLSRGSLVLATFSLQISLFW